ncbi:MAG: hypothetical protein EOO01_06495, partial [Chitinophagaceae bacterium]
MKSLFLPLLASFFICNFSSSLHNSFASYNYESVDNYLIEPGLVLRDSKNPIPMASVLFKSQEFCRVEVENVDADIKLEVVGATVTFSGSNFVNPRVARIKSKELRPIK